MMRFELHRQVDVTGVSGTGHVADGVLFGDGVVVVRWRGAHATTTVHASLASVDAIHLHGGATQIRWLDAWPQVVDCEGRPILVGFQVLPKTPTEFDDPRGFQVTRVYHEADGTPMVSAIGWPECGYGLGAERADRMRVVGTGLRVVE
jgi:hypothetical protein